MHHHAEAAILPLSTTLSPPLSTPLTTPLSTPYPPHPSTPLSTSLSNMSLSTSLLPRGSSHTRTAPTAVPYALFHDARDVYGWWEWVQHMRLVCLSLVCISVSCVSLSLVCLSLLHLCLCLAHLYHERVSQRSTEMHKRESLSIYISLAFLRCARETCVVSLIEMHLSHACEIEMHLSHRHASLACERCISHIEMHLSHASLSELYPLYVRDASLSEWVCERCISHMRCTHCNLCISVLCSLSDRDASVRCASYSLTCVSHRCISIMSLSHRLSEAAYL